MNLAEAETKWHS